MVCQMAKLIVMSMTGAQSCSTRETKQALLQATGAAQADKRAADEVAGDDEACGTVLTLEAANIAIQDRREQRPLGRAGAGWRKQETSQLAAVRDKETREAG